MFVYQLAFSWFMFDCCCRLVLSAALICCCCTGRQRALRNYFEHSRQACKGYALKCHAGGSYWIVYVLIQSLLITNSDIMIYCLLQYFFNIPAITKQSKYKLDLLIVWINNFFYLSQLYDSNESQIYIYCITSKLMLVLYIGIDYCAYVDYAPSLLQ